MASSDEEDESVPMSVENYYFNDDKDEPVPFSELPVLWAHGGEGATAAGDDDRAKLFLRGDVDKKLRKIFKTVVAWKFDLSNVKPEVSVLSKEKAWIKLESPRKSYEEDIIRPILVTLQCLHFAMRNPESSGKSLWDSVAKNFSSFEVRPSEKDLGDHKSLISEAVERYDALAKSKFLIEFRKGKARKRRQSDEGVRAKPMAQFIVSDSEDDIGGDEEDDDDDEDGMFDSACALCDNGGDIICCEGSCLRSFHATVDDECDCDTLGLTNEEVKATPQFLCKNCELKQHQCYICGKLGSSDNYSGAEVFQCVSASCGYFYHPCCVSRVIHADNMASAEELEKKIVAGESFTCPAHKCHVCKHGENKKDPPLQFAVCRRCPRSYHRKCLPKDLPFEGDDSDAVTRAWEGLLPNRILIYCLLHKIDEDIGTPSRDHIKFPGVEEKKTVFAKKKAIVEVKRPRPKPESSGERKKIELKARALPSKPSHLERQSSDLKQTKKLSSTRKIEVYKTSGNFGSGSSGSVKKLKKVGSFKTEPKFSQTGINKQALGNKLYEAFTHKNSEPGEEEVSDDEVKPESIALDDDSKQRVLGIIKGVESSVRMEDVKAKLKVPSTHGSSHKSFGEKFITTGKVDTYVKAVREASARIDEGLSVEDAKAVCDLDVLIKLSRWKNKLKIYLNPFLIGMRYTSFGRHFTKPKKLEEIVNKIHWYVQEGDTVVDFCCGSNDFSILLKKKLEETGKKCLFKNYDLMPPKNDFNYEKRDWKSVEPHELPPGSKLIMGLNPPFGIKGSLANVFIDKALKFNPKLIVLIVPEETERLDQKENPYDLIWEDNQMLKGKSFYLPGSMDAKDNILEQWNTQPPPLYLWSHPNWTDRYKAIAEAHDHISKQPVEFVDRDYPALSSPDHPSDSHDGGGGGDDNATDNYLIGNDDYDIDANNIPSDAVDKDGFDGNHLIPTKNPTKIPFETAEYKKSSPPTTSSEERNSHGGERNRRGNANKQFNENSRKRARQRSKEKNKKRPGGLPIEPNHHHHHQRHNGDTWPPVREFRSQGMSPYLTDDPYVSGSPSLIRGNENYHRHGLDYGARSVNGQYFPRDESEGGFIARERQLEMESSIQSVHHYGQPDPSFAGRSYLQVQEPSLTGNNHYHPISTLAPMSSTYANLSPAVEASYRISPPGGPLWIAGRPDELHRSSMTAFGSEPMNFVGNMYDPRLGHIRHSGPPAPPPLEFAPSGFDAYPPPHPGSLGVWFDRPGL